MPRYSSLQSSLIQRMKCFTKSKLTISAPEIHKKDENEGKKKNIKFFVTKSTWFLSHSGNLIHDCCSLWLYLFLNLFLLRFFIAFWIWKSFRFNEIWQSHWVSLLSVIQVSCAMCSIFFIFQIKLSIHHHSLFGVLSLKWNHVWKKFPLWHGKKNQRRRRRWRGKKTEWRWMTLN